MVPTLENGIIWEDCADLPKPFSEASAVLHDNKVYTMARSAKLLDKEAYNYVYVYDIDSNQWDRLPPPGQHRGTLLIINNKLTVIGGCDNNEIYKATSKVTTYNNNSWSNEYANLQKGRKEPGAVTHLDYVIVAGGSSLCSSYNVHDDIEILNYKQSSNWEIATVKLPLPTERPFLTISDSTLYFMGHHGTTIIGSAYAMSVDTVTSSEIQDSWTKLPPLPYTYSAMIPRSHPPVLVGGKKNQDEQHAPTDDIMVLDIPSYSWKKIASLKTARVATAIVPINHDSILVIGGSLSKPFEDGTCFTSSYINTVQKGTVMPHHKQ